MKKNLIFWKLIAIIVVGSFINFYSTNLIASDVSNSFYKAIDAYVLSSFPLFFVSLYFIAMTVFYYRLVSKPGHKKAMIKLYSIILLSFAILGLTFTFLTGTLCYHSFVAPYPFPGYTIIMLIVHTLMLAISIYMGFVYTKKLPEDEEKQKISGGYIFHTVVVCLLIYFALNRFGAFLWSPIYIDWPTFYYTFPFYLSMCLPLSLLIFSALYRFGYLEHTLKTSHDFAVALVFIALILSVYIAILGLNSQTFVAVLSPALGIERLLCFPIEAILSITVTIIFAGYVSILASKLRRKNSIKK